MPTPAKPYAVLVSEKKSHRTKKELKARKEAEEALITGTKLKERPEVRNNPIAHKEFQRVDKILKTINKNDAIYEPVINRYCLIQAEVLDFEQKREKTYEIICTMRDYFEEALEDMSPEEKILSIMDVGDKLDKLTKTIIAYDRQIQAKRKMLFDIEKENIMTIAAALRNIPKSQEKAENQLLKALNGN
jgi:phage terminase small subunit